MVPRAACAECGASSKLAIDSLTMANVFPAIAIRPVTDAAMLKGSAMARERGWINV